VGFSGGGGGALMVKKQVSIYGGFLGRRGAAPSRTKNAISGGFRYKNRLMAIYGMAICGGLFSRFGRVHRWGLMYPMWGTWWERCECCGMRRPALEDDFPSVFKGKLNDPYSLVCTPACLLCK